MSDPYLNFTGDNDLSNIQVNIFRVKGPLRKMVMKEKERYLHNESFIFNPKFTNFFIILCILPHSFPFIKLKKFFKF